ncbi:unannotated protein [freshwater metagenome]|uniref:Unannotated protein n=1 Tax=freshwater metagenome TaxID=449393 RepID=A0A6J6CGS3_9ZZZZ
MIFGGFSTDLGVGTCAESTSKLATHIELDVRFAHEKGLCVSVDGNELDTLESALDHAIDCVDATTADADHLDDGEEVLIGIHVRPPRKP